VLCAPPSGKFVLILQKPSPAIQIAIVARIPKHTRFKVDLFGLLPFSDFN